MIELLVTISVAMLNTDYIEKSLNGGRVESYSMGDMRLNMICRISL